VRERQRVKLAGRIHALRVQPWSGQPTLECTVTDGTGKITVVFLGRRQIAGVEPGARIVVEGIVGVRRGQLVMLNPEYRLLPAPDAASSKKFGKH
jgi:RecG-like helicase